jgi:hypothetical protein
MPTQAAVVAPPRVRLGRSWPATTMAWAPCNCWLEPVLVKLIWPLSETRYSAPSDAETAPFWIMDSLCRTTKPLAAPIRAPGSTVMVSRPAALGGSRVMVVIPVTPGLSSWDMPPAALRGPVTPAKDPTSTTASDPKMMPPEENSHTPPVACSVPRIDERGLRPVSGFMFTRLKAIHVGEA